MATTKKTPAKGTRTTAAKQKAAEAQARKRLYAILLFALGALVVAVSAVPGEKLWLTLHHFLLGSFSWCAYLLGPIIIYTAVMVDLDKSTFPIAAKVISSVVLVVMLCGASHIFSKAVPPEGGLLSLIDWLYKSGIRLEGGGAAGILLGIPLMHWLDFTGAAITIVVLIFVSLMIISGSTLVGLFKNALVKPVRRMEEAYVTAAVNRAQLAEEAERPQGKKAQRQAQMMMGENKTKLMEAVNAMDKPVGGTTGAPGPGTAVPTAGPNERFFDFDAHNREDKPQPQPKPTVKPAPIDAPEDIFGPEPPKAEKPAAKPVDKPAPPPQPPQEVLPPGELTLDEIISRAAQPGGQRPAVDAVLDAPILVPKPIIETENGLLNFGMRDDPQREREPEAQAPAPLPEAAPPPPPPPPAPSAAASGPAVLHPAYNYPPVTLLREAKALPKGDTSKELKANADRLVDTLKSFGVQTRIVDISRGPAVTRYELQPSAGVKISRITNLADDIALNLASAGVRIEAPIPNKAAIGIEVPNKVISTVPIREILDSEGFREAKSKLTVVLGKDITGELAFADLARMPHLLIAGATGSGKSVCINSLIVSLLFKAGPEEVKLLMVDPKVVELGGYNGIPHLLSPVVTDAKKAAGALCTMVGEMLRRYKLFADHNVRDLGGFNKLAETRDELEPLPHIVIIIDELADLMMASPKDVEDYICRLAQMARAAGMHLVIATQRPSVDVITGVIKANIPSRISFAVSSQIDSRTILDMGGAEKLMGRGDMLFYPVGNAKPTRVQGCFVTDGEVEAVVDYIKNSSVSNYDETLMEEIEKNAAQVGGKGSGSRGGSSSNDADDTDELLNAAIEAVVEAGQASTSLLQRRIKVGYARAARLVDEMEQRGIVGPFEGSKPRQVLISKERWYEMKMNNAD